MSVGEEQIECPLCMEPLEMDDINFFPCTCGYQICRFCWHRIRTDENGLCPACRKPYPEDPAEFKPLTEDELQRIKRERRQKDLQRKQKAAENRKHLANVRVVQKNLVFVVGLSQRLAEPEVLKKHEYFGKFGKIHKVVINQSTSYAGAQGPSASAYVTYNRPEDALRAIQAVNNIHVDGRTIKASLGTTKYCSHFLRGTQCPKPDCMYLHELGEEAASFTKEEMQQGKHQEYEQRLYEQYMNNQNLINHTTGNKAPPASTKQKTGSPIMGQQAQPPHHANKDAWPSLNSGKADSSRVTNGHKAPPQQQQQQQQAPAVTSKTESNPPHNRAPGNNRNRQIPSPQDSINGKAKAPGSPPQQSHCGPPLHTSGGYSTEQATPPPHTSATFTSSICKSPFLDSADSSLSLFSSSGFPTMKSLQPATQPQPQNTDENIPNTEISDTIPVSSSTDWQAAFGFGSSSVESHDDDLGFDPWRESTKALADLMEKEGNGTFSQNSDRNSDSLDSRARVPPPGFSCQMGAFNNPLRTGQTANKMLGLVHLSSALQSNISPVNTCNNVLTDFAFRHRDNMANNHSQGDAYNMKDWQDGLRALLPNINISFGGQQGQSAPLPQPPHSSTHHTLSSPPPRSSFNNSNPQQVPATANSHRQTAFTPSPPDLSWDPAIVSSGHIADKVIGSSDEPHWMASLQHLTEIDTPTPNHRFPCLQPFPFRAPNWAPQTQHPPPGFQAPLQPTSQMPGTQKVAGGLQ